MYAEQAEVAIADLRPGSYRVCGTVRGRIYHKSFDAPSKDWTSTGHRGLIVFGRDWQGDNDSSISGSSSASDDESERFWFRLVDDSKTTWIFRTSGRLDYQVDKPFFHIFPGKVSSSIYLHVPGSH